MPVGVITIANGQSALGSHVSATSTDPRSRCFLTLEFVRFEQRKPLSSVPFYRLGVPARLAISHLRAPRRASTARIGAGKLEPLRQWHRPRFVAHRFEGTGGACWV